MHSGSQRQERQQHFNNNNTQLHDIPNFASIVCQFCDVHGHSCRFCPSFRNYFQPRNSAPYVNFNSTPALPPPPSAPVQYAGSSSAPAELCTLNENTNAILGSTLNPNAPPFNAHPNW